MANIVSKLNLNRTPNIVDNNSLIFAKNIRLDVDGSIHKDYGILPLYLEDTNEDYYKAHNGFFQHVLDDINKIIEQGGEEYYVYFKNKFDIIKKYKYQPNIVGIIPDNTSFYVFLHCLYTIDETNTKEEVFDCIIKYDEKTKSFYPCNCKWSYSGGKIDGCVINNLYGESILNIGETSNTNKLIPLKCINLSKSNYLDDESIYTQTPNIPITNLHFKGLFTFTIPNGVYQFFIRYKIRDGFYTDWFPASKELFAGNTNRTTTNFGSLKYVNYHRDSDYSFSFNVEHLFASFNHNYKSFQVGFIVSHDDAIYARAWKHFVINTTEFQFTYKAEEAEEIEVTDLLNTTYQLYNVGNITSFKNKLYISNYTESDFNEDISSDIINNIKVTTGYKDIRDFYNFKYDNTIVSNINGSNYISEFGNIKINGNDGLISKLIKQGEGANLIENIFKVAPVSNEDIFKSIKFMDCQFVSEGNNLESVRKNTEDAFRRKGITSKINWDVEQINGYPNRVTVNGKEYFNSSEPFDTPVEGNTIEERMAAIAKIVTNRIIDDIINNIYYINDNAVFVNDKYEISDKYEIVFHRKCSYTKTTYVPTFDNDFNIKDETDFIEDDNNIPDFTIPSDPGQKIEQTIIEEYNQTITFCFAPGKEILAKEDNNELLNLTTLIPYQKYKFYIHFIKQSGEVTNGHPVKCINVGDTKETDELNINYEPECNKIIYPIFNTIECPDGYVGYFFSIRHSGITSSTIYGVTYQSGQMNDGSAAQCYEGSCLDIDTRLNPLYDNIICKQENQTVKGKYFYSSDTSVIRYFGANGVVQMDLGALKEDEENPSIIENKLVYAITDYKAVDDRDANLIKCTPFIKSSIQTYDNYDRLNLGGYICTITPTSRTRTIRFYSDGSSVYVKDGVDEETFLTTKQGMYDFHLTELSKYNKKNNTGAYANDRLLRNFKLYNTADVRIYSNFNFNFVNLSEDPKNTAVTYYDRFDDEVPDGYDNTANSILLNLLTSLTMSDIYELQSMYRSYTRKMYSVKETSSITRFNNTVRSSILQGDEDIVSIFKFDADEYYNIPTNRGIIINLVAIGDAIVVHTTDSIFKFTGSNNLSSNNGEILQTESKPFDTGVSEAFGSDFGFAGLQNKDDQIITELGYIFFDRDAKTIYLYSGNGQITKISDSIEKLFRHKDIANIYFANDYYNNRFFVSIYFVDNTTATLSFSLIESVKSFISLHDFAFSWAFNTKANCYFINNSRSSICNIRKNAKGIYIGVGTSIDTIYPQSKHKTFIITSKPQPGTIASTIPTYYYDSIIDIIDNSNYELIKTLNSIQWCSCFVYTEFGKINNNNVLTTKMADIVETKKPYASILIYTDTCMGEKLEFGIMSNEYSITNPNSYKCPKYNQGRWNLNYFRDIQNTQDIFNYLTPRKDGKPSYDDGRENAKYRSDNNGLIEGKYFVVRFYFSDDFKLETLSFNYNNKL